MIHRFARPAALCILLILVGCSHASPPTAASPGSAATTGPAALVSPDFVRPLLKRAFDYQVTAQAQKKPDGGWIRAAFYTGVISAYHATGDRAYLDQTMAWAENQGHWKPARGDWRFADNYCNAQVYCDLYQLKHDPRMIAASRENLDRIMANPKPGRLDWWWCDALYMGPASFAKMSQVTGDQRYLDFMNSMYWDSVDFLYRPQYHLFFRDRSFFNARTLHGQPVFWARGNGWVIGGLAHVLEAMPAKYPYRDRYVGLLRDMSSELITLQGADGLWRSSLLDPTQFPTPETSGSSFFTFAMAWGINNGVLDRAAFLPHVLRGWAGLASMVDSQGKLTHVQGVAGSPARTVPSNTHEYAVGAFLMAGAEVLKLKPTSGELAKAFKGYSPPTLDDLQAATTEPAVNRK